MDDGPGVKKKSRRKAKTRFYHDRRFRIGAVLVVFLLLTGLTLYQVVVLSPRRQKYHYYQDGLIAYGQDRFQEAEILFRKFLALEPDRAEAQHMLGLTLFRLGEPEEAVQALEEAARLEAGFDPANIALSEYYRKHGDFRRALACAERAIATDPVGADAWIARAEVRILLGDHSGAIADLKEALLDDPGLVEIRLKLGDLYLARRMIGLESLGDLSATDEYEQAKQGALAILRDDPGNPKALLWLGKAYAGLGDLDAAIAQLDRLVREEPKDPDHRLLLARFHGAVGDYEREVAILEKALQETPSADIAIRLARTLTNRLTDPQRARQVLTAATRSFPDDPRPYIALADHLRRRDRVDEAAAVLRDALARFPANGAVLEARGDLHLAAGETEEALAAWRRVLQVQPARLSARRKILARLVPEVVAEIDRGETEPAGYEEVEGHLAFFLDPKTGVNPSDLMARGWQARLLFARGDFDAARDLLAAGKGRVEPGSYEGLRLLGTASFLAGDHFKAAEVLRKALAHPDCPKEPEDFELAYSACYRRGRPDWEVEVARSALRKWPRDVEWRLRLARSLFRAGRYDSALAAANEAKADLAGQKDVRAHLLAARIHQARAELDQARAELQSAVVIRNDARTRGALYSFFEATGDEKLAEQGFRALVDENPNDASAWLALGDFFMKRGEEEQAFQQYQKARQLEPESREAVYRVTELRIAQAVKAANREEAIAAVERAVREISLSDPDDPHLVYFTGKLHLLKGENEEALSALERYVRENPNDSAGLYYLAIAYRRSGDPEQARDQFLAALNLEPAMVEAKLELATLYFSEGVRARFSGDLEGARAAFERITKYDPKEPETRRFLAETLASLGLVDRAAQEASRVLEVRPDDTGALFLTGLLAAKRADLDLAEERFRRLTELLPENYRGHLYLGMVYAERLQFDPAREELRRALTLDPDANEVLHALAVVEVAADNAAEALRIVQAERERRPREPFVHHLLGDLYRSAGRAREAIAAYRRAFSLDPGNTNSLGLAAALTADEGDLDGAVALLAEGARTAPRPAGLLTLRARMLLSAGRGREAEADLREALAADAEYGPALRELGLVCARTGREEEGRELLEKAVAAGVVDAAVHFRLGTLAGLRGENERAEKEYRRVLELVPDDAVTLNNLAVLVSRDEARLDQARELAEKARSLDEKDPRMADTLGWILYRQGKHDDAVRLLLEAAEALPGDADTLFHAGMACYRAYLWDRARPLLRKALDLDADLEGAEEARRALEEMR